MVYPPTDLVRVALVAALLLAAMNGPAAAYIGPGGMMSLLSMGLAMLAAFSVSVMLVLTWPYRAAKRWLQQRREKAEGKPEGAATAEEKAEEH